MTVYNYDHPLAPDRSETNEVDYRNGTKRRGRRVTVLPHQDEAGPCPECGRMLVFDQGLPVHRFVRFLNECSLYRAETGG